MKATSRRWCVATHRSCALLIPAAAIHGSRTKHIAPAYRRYLENFFRQRYKLEGTPVRIDFRDGENPYAGKKNVLTEAQQRKRQRMISEMKRRKR
jgi:GTP-binding protein